MGVVGRFCQANILWSVVAILLLWALTQAGMVPEPEALPQQNETKYCSIPIHLDDILLSSSPSCEMKIAFLGRFPVEQIQLVLLTILGALSLGVAYSVRTLFY